MLDNNKAPKDTLGNDLFEGAIVTLTIDKPLICRVMKMQQGGVHTPQGVTPGILLVGVQLTIQFVPGVPLLNIVRVVSPGSDEMAKKILDGVF